MKPGTKPRTYSEIEAVRLVWLAAFVSVFSFLYYQRHGDILLYGDKKIRTETLTVPHPRMTQRAFTLIPLLQLDPFIKIPGQGAAHQFVPGAGDQPRRR